MVFFPYKPELLIKIPLILNILTTGETIWTGFITSWKRCPHLARTHQRYPKPSGNPSPKVIPWLFAHVNLISVFLFLILMAENPLLCWIPCVIWCLCSSSQHGVKEHQGTGVPGQSCSWNQPCAATQMHPTHPSRHWASSSLKSRKLSFLQTCREAVGNPLMVKNSLESSDFDLAALWFSSVHTASFNCFSLWISPSLHPLQPFLCWKTN